jgi:hypothetical protein
MEMIGRDCKFRVRVIGPRLARRDLKFTPKGIDILLGVAHPRELHHVVACGRVGAIGPYHEIETDLDLRGSPEALLAGWPVLDLKPRLTLSEIRSCQLVVEEDFDIRHILEGIQERLVDPCPIDGKDGLLAAVSVVVAMRRVSANYTFP